MSVESLFLNVAAAKLRQSANRISACLARLNDDQIWARGHTTENAIGNLILHLAGNARQWIVSGLGGQPDIRVREKEFSTEGGMSREALISTLTATVSEACEVIGRLSAEQLTRIYRIQNREPSGVEAVLNVVEHFGQHTGQIIFATKNLTGEDLGLSTPAAAGRK